MACSPYSSQSNPAHQLQDTALWRCIAQPQSVRNGPFEWSDEAGFPIKSLSASKVSDNCLFCFCQSFIYFARTFDRSKALFHSFSNPSRPDLNSFDSQIWQRQSLFWVLPSQGCRLHIGLTRPPTNSSLIADRDFRLLKDTFPALTEEYNVVLVSPNDHAYWNIASVRGTY